MTPLTLPWQTTLFSQVEVHPPAPTYRYYDYWGTPGHRVRPATAAQRAEGDRVQPGRDATRRAAGRRRLGRAAGAAVADEHAELLARDAARRPIDADLAAAARHGRRRRGARTRPPRRSPTGCGPTSPTCPGSTGVQTQRAGGVEPAQGRLPGHRPPDRRRCCARVGIPARYVSGYLHPKRGGRDRRDGRRAEPRLGGVVVRRLGRLRPDERRAGRAAARGGGPRPRLRRRHAAEGRLPRAPSSAPGRHGGDHPGHVG